MFKKFFDLIATLPTTNLRILWTLTAATATGAKYLLTPGWEPSAEWLMFIAGMAGWDTFQYVGKRVTFKPTPNDIGDFTNEEFQDTDMSNK